MKDKHPIDKIFRDTLNDPDIPFDEREWKALSQKMSPRGERRASLLIWIGCGAAAAVVLAAILLFGDGQSPVDDTTSHTTARASADVQSEARPGDSTATPDQDTVRAGSAPIAGSSEEPMQSIKGGAINGQAITGSLGAIQHDVAPITRRPIPSVAPHFKPTIHTLPTIIRPLATSLAPAAPQSTIPAPPEDATREWTIDNGRQRGWALSVIVAPDLSGTRPVSGKISGNVGIIATYRLNNWLSLSGGALYAKKLYTADFGDYRPRTSWNYQTNTPDRVAADCNVLDIPLNLNIDVKQLPRSSWFASVGISSYFMLRERYEYSYSANYSDRGYSGSYSPHDYGNPKPLTLHNQNRHLLGVGNVAVGYRRKLNSSISLTVQPFLKVPLTGIGNGNLKLYSTGVAISADIKLSPSRR